MHRHGHHLLHHLHHGLQRPGALVGRHQARGATPGEHARHHSPHRDHGLQTGRGRGRQGRGRGHRQLERDEAPGEGRPEAGDRGGPPVHEGSGHEGHDRRRHRHPEHDAGQHPHGHLGHRPRQEKLKAQEELWSARHDGRPWRVAGDLRLLGLQHAAPLEDAAPLPRDVHHLDLPPGRRVRQHRGGPAGAPALRAGGGEGVHWRAVPQLRPRG
mmetsp:Transcript_1714/g.4837  ORF Transcript_1714/g.4837 Transcript_1714/m.4837 type:complete len:213 (+) Transcript_1714:478-1116(+)